MACTQTKEGSGSKSDDSPSCNTGVLRPRSPYPWLHLHLHRKGKELEQNQLTHLPAIRAFLGLGHRTHGCTCTCTGRAKNWSSQIRNGKQKKGGMRNQMLSLVAQREEEKSGERIWDEEAWLMSIVPARASKAGNMRQGLAVLTNCSNGGASLPSNWIGGERETTNGSMQRSLGSHGSEWAALAWWGDGGRGGRLCCTDRRRRNGGMAAAAESGEGEGGGGE
jgi:hypothetical protein